MLYTLYIEVGGILGVGMCVYSRNRRIGPEEDGAVTQQGELREPLTQ